MEELQKEEVIEETEEEKKWCVYMHTSPNRKVYIGITSQMPEKRWLNGHGYRNNQYFWRAIQKYGWHNFEHTILYEKLNKKDACQKEIELIAFYDSTNPKKGYNLSTGGEAPLGYHLSDEAKQKISKAHKGKIVSEETKNKIRGKNNPNYGKPRAAEVRKKISEAHKGKPSPRKGIPHTEESKRKMSEAKIGKVSGKNNPNYGNHKLAGENSPNYGTGLAVVQFDKEGHRITEYISCLYAEKTTGIPQANIRKCCKGEVVSAGGFMWRFAKDCNEEHINAYVNPKHKSIVQLDLNNNLIRLYDSIKEAANCMRVSNSDIVQCCRGITKTCSGFRWMYKEDYKQQFENLNKDKKEK